MIVPPKVKSRKRARAEAAPISGINIDALLGPKAEAPKTIDPEDPIPSFLKLLDGAESPAAIREAAEALSKIVERHIAESFGGNLYGKATEEMRVMREEMIEVEEPGVYNTVLRKLKEKLVKEESGGERKDFWYEMRKNRLGLIDKKASEHSDVAEDEAREVSVGIVGIEGSQLTLGVVQCIQMIPSLEPLHVRSMFTVLFRYVCANRLATEILEEQVPSGAQAQGQQHREEACYAL